LYVRCGYYILRQQPIKDPARHRILAAYLATAYMKIVLKQEHFLQYRNILFLGYDTYQVYK